MPLGSAITKAMQAAHTIVGEYKAQYSEATRLWTIWVDSSEVSSFELSWFTGANKANSIAATVGFADTVDATGKLSYLATVELQHLCCKVLEKKKEYIFSDDPKVKRSAADAGTAYAPKNDLGQRLGSGNIYFGSGGTLIQVYPKNDCCG